MVSETTSFSTCLCVSLVSAIEVTTDMQAYANPNVCHVFLGRDTMFVDFICFTKKVLKSECTPAVIVDDVVVQKRYQKFC